MKRHFPLVPLFLYIFLYFTTTGSYRLHWRQTYLWNEGVSAYWSCMEMEDFVVAATYNNSQLVFKQIWSKGNIPDQQWNLYNVFLNKYFSAINIIMVRIARQVEVKGKHTFECWAGCPSSMDEFKDFSYQMAANSEYQLHFDIKRQLWVAEQNPLAQAAQKILQEDKTTINDLAVHVPNMCIQFAQLFSDAGKDVFLRRVQPQVYITSKPDQSGTDVICMVTGFYPKAINISLWKENKMEDVLSTETLPNGDGTYQMTVLANINVIRDHSVYCQVEHSSLKLPLKVYLEKKRHSPSGLIVGIMVGVVLCLVALAYVKKKSVTSVAMVVLI